MLFDVRAAKVLKAGDHLTVPGAPGLRLVASTTGHSWIYRYKSPVDGRMKQVKLGTWPETSAAQAGVEWERLRGERAAGRDASQERREPKKATPAAPKATPAADDTVGELIDGYARWSAPRRTAKGAAELQRTLRVGVDDDLRALAPAGVTRTTAFDLISRYAGTPVQAGVRREGGSRNAVHLQQGQQAGVGARRGGFDAVHVQAVQHQLPRASPPHVVVGRGGARRPRCWRWVCCRASGRRSAATWPPRRSDAAAVRRRRGRIQLRHLAGRCDPRGRDSPRIGKEVGLEDRLTPSASARA